MNTTVSCFAICLLVYPPFSVGERYKCVDPVSGKVEYRGFECNPQQQREEAIGDDQAYSVIKMDPTTVNAKLLREYEAKQRRLLDAQERGADREIGAWQKDLEKRNESVDSVRIKSQSKETLSR